MKRHLELFITFAKIGVMTFGGGLAMLPMLERELVKNKEWVSLDELNDYYAIGQCTPGIIAVNTATFVGNKLAGFTGGMAATLGMVFPSIVIITILASVIATYSSNSVVQDAFAGIQAAICVMILNSLTKITKKAVVDRVTLILLLAVLVLSFVFGVSPVIGVLLSAVVGILVRLRREEVSS